jgi:hypothetical protein
MTNSEFEKCATEEAQKWRYPANPYDSFKAGALWGHAQGANDAEELQHEITRLNILVKIADELITNDNAKEDWINAKQTRIM